MKREDAKKTAYYLLSSLRYRSPRDEPFDDVVDKFTDFVMEAVAIEREACAQVCDSVDNYANPMTAKDCADAIRARGER